MGDFYAYWQTGPHELTALLGDATGKGLTAALLAARCVSVIQSLSGLPHSPAKILVLANRTLCQQFGKDGHFVTAILAKIDFQSGQIRLSLAGHNPPCWSQSPNAPVQCISSEDGFPLGVQPEAEYEDIVCEYAPGATLLLYSDGVTEAQDPQGGLYGMDRLEAAFAQARESALPDMLTALQTELERHRRGQAISDDATFLLLRMV